MDILNRPLTVSAPLISTLCSMHRRRHWLGHLVFRFKIKFFFGMAFLFSMAGQFLFILPAFISHFNIETLKIKKCCLYIVVSYLLTLSLSLSALSNTVFLSLFLPPFLSPSIGDGPYSCPETAALHHSQCKSNHALLLFTSPVYPSLCFLLCLSLSLFGFMPLHQCDIRKDNATCHFCLCLTSLVIIYCTSCLTPVPFSLFHPLPCV